MEEQLITFETALLAKEKGFVEVVNKAYYKEANDEILVYDSGPLAICYAPTQSLLQKWLRERHSIHTVCEHKSKGKYYYHVYYGEDCKRMTSYKLEYLLEYEEALEIGLQEALKLL